MKLGGTIFTYLCLATTVILGTISVRYLTLGADNAAQAFMGLAITILSFIFFESEVILHWERFATYQILFIAGIALVTPFIQSGTPFTTTTSFEVGSFSLVVTGFFITTNREEYRNILLLSCTATLALFFAGMLSAFRDVPGASFSSAGIASATNYLVTALFLVGSVDLAFLSAMLFAHVVIEIKKDPRARLPAS
jgi:hypothetical protein